MRTDLSVNQSTIMECRTEDFLSACGTAGFHSVELRVPKLKESFYTAPAGTIERLLEKYDIQVVALNSIDDFALVSEEYLSVFEAELKQVAEMCRRVSCRQVVAPAGRWFGARLEREQVVERTCARLDLAATLLGGAEVSVGFEPIGFPEFTVRDLEFANEIVGQCTSRNIFLVADVYNLANAGTSPEQAAPYVPLVKLVHINDADNTPAEHRHVMYSRTFPGEGAIDVAEWVAVFLSGGYEGPFSLEIFDRDLWQLSPDDAARTAYSKLSNYFESLKTEV